MDDYVCGKTGAYERSVKTANLPLPIGIADYCLVSTQYYYIDKTMMIKDFIDERPMVSLFTRPRHFGKTLNMDMLRVFFEKADDDTSIYFKDKNIWACGQHYRDYQGKYPVISVTFKDVKCDDWASTYCGICQALRKEVLRHGELLSSDRINSFDKKYLENILNGTASEIDMAMTFINLSRMLDTHYNQPPIIIIDEYDTPIQQGYILGFYDKVTGFMRNLFCGGLKDNRHLSFGILSGVRYVAGDKVFCDLNNISINSIFDRRYSSYFGFTLDEIKKIAGNYGVSEKNGEIHAWYGGYRFSNTELFNPWSVINYIQAGCKPKVCWHSSECNDIIKTVATVADSETYAKLASLSEGDTITAYIDTGVIFPHIDQNPAGIFSYLLTEGYLSAVKSELIYGVDFICELLLPNEEIRQIFNRIIP